MSENQDRGRAIEWGWIQVGRDRSIGYTSVVCEEDIARCLHDDAKNELPPNTRYELRRMMPLNYGRTNGIAWLWTPEFTDSKEWGKAQAGYNAESGYSLVGQFITPCLPLHRAKTVTEIE